MTMISGLVSGRRRATSTASAFPGHPELLSLLAIPIMTAVHNTDALAPPGSRASYDDPKDGGDEDTTVVEPDQGNVLSHIIAQLRPGADLSRVTLPTFILEPRSMLERITKYLRPNHEPPDFVELTTIPQLHVPPRAPPTDTRHRRPRGEICVRRQVLPKRLAYPSSRSQEALEPHSWRSLLLLLGSSGPDKSLLHI